MLNSILMKKMFTFSFLGQFSAYACSERLRFHPEFEIRGRTQRDDLRGQFQRSFVLVRLRREPALVLGDSAQRESRSA